METYDILGLKVGWFLKPFVNLFGLKYNDC